MRLSNWSESITNQWDQTTLSIYLSEYLKSDQLAKQKTYRTSLYISWKAGPSNQIIRTYSISSDLKTEVFWLKSMPSRPTNHKNTKVLYYPPNRRGLAINKTVRMPTVCLFSALKILHINLHLFREDTVTISVADPWHFGTDPDPRIRASD
jgi:hypothetical protein